LAKSIEEKTFLVFNKQTKITLHKHQQLSMAITNLEREQNSNGLVLAK